MDGDQTVMNFNFSRGAGNAYATETFWQGRLRFIDILEEKFGLTPQEKLDIEETKSVEFFCRKNKNKKDRAKFLLQIIKRRQNALSNPKDNGRDNRFPATISSNAIQYQKRGN